MDDVASGAYDFLVNQPAVTAAIGSFPADDPDNAGVPWIFVRTPYTRMEDSSIVKGSQAVALVTCYMGQAASPVVMSTARQVRLEVDIWVDPLRDAMGNVTNPSETENRGLGIYDLIDSYLNRVAVDENTQLWGDLVTVSSARMSEPIWYPVPDGDGLIRGVCFYNVGCYGNAEQSEAVGSGDSGSGAGGQ